MGRRSFFQKVGNTKIIPISLKIVAIFTCLLLLSNFATNCINLILNQRQIIKLNNEIMVSQLKDIYTAANNQYQIVLFNGERNNSINALKSIAKGTFTLPSSIALAVKKDGDLLFSVCANGTEIDEELVRKYKDSVLENTADSSSISEEVIDYSFYDKEALSFMNDNLNNSIEDGSINFQTIDGQYFGVYKYQSEWECFFIRAELRSDTTKSTNTVLGLISLIILIVVIGFLIVGLFLFKKILSSVTRITNSLYQMQQKQELATIDLSSATNDDITYLAASFNSLSSTINNLLGIFQKFVSKDVVKKAYDEHQILLEGKRRNLTILFSDIRSFTYRTETLGNDIIDLLNVHYDKVIHSVHENSGVIGSIIGDAVLAIYGTERTKNKSIDSLDSAWNITTVTASLREKMIARRSEIEKSRILTEAEERVYQAVLIDVGVGIDGGNVFYGNIGSDEHMTNTVIGDNVNSASRLEGLTRVYHLPVICSDYIKEEVENKSSKYKFFEIDTVQVKGKTEGKKIYFPMNTEICPSDIEEKFLQFEKGLKAYYSGDWTLARTEFKKCDLEVVKVFLERMGKSNAPANWSGIWTMQTK
ncbi:MAG: adenylate/guanylate cyclase domain-containing protein [Treponema sp.]|nr:adenylate/guanylate cyclase domain-containing protein [Treponema sp.]MBP3607696.1 adenylate/guanylate cyclase domain-containing protein [Treponema sp.]